MSGMGRDVHAAFLEARLESLISCLIFGGARACGWMRELMLQTAPDGIECRDC